MATETLKPPARARHARFTHGCVEPRPKSRPLAARRLAVVPAPVGRVTSSWTGHVAQMPRLRSTALGSPSKSHGQRSHWPRNRRSWRRAICARLGRSSAA